MKTKTILRAVLIATIILIIFGVIGKKQGWFGGDTIYKVAVEEASFRTIVETITANGRIQPETEVKISPDVSGEIVELAVVEGQQVKAGDLLVRIKQDYYLSSRDRVSASLNSAKANLANAKATQLQTEAQAQQEKLSFKRSESLHQQGVLSIADFEAAQAQYAVALAQVEAVKQQVAAASFSVKSAAASLREAEENLRKTTIYAPISGTIYGLHVELGERVVGTGQMSGTEMLRIADLRKMEALVQVNENDIIRVSTGDSAYIEIDSYIDQRFLGKVTEIANSANTSGASLDQVTSFNVKILLLSESYQHLIPEDQAGFQPFRPGMSTTVDIQTEARHQVISVPIQSVTTRADSGKFIDPTVKKGEDEPLISSDELLEVVFIVEGDRAIQKTVVSGIQDKNYIQIIDGLSENELVVAAPFSAIAKKLENQTRVEMVKKEDLFQTKKSQKKK